MKKKIFIDARINEGDNPGIESFVRAIATAFAENPREEFDINWLVSERNSWLTSILPSNQTFHVTETRGSSVDLENSKSLKENQEKFIDSIDNRADYRLPREPEFLSKHNPDLVMFCCQDAFITSYPSIYHPHDLQHHHYTSNFSLETFGWREIAWRSFAFASDYVVVGTAHVGLDITRFWGISSSKVKVIPVAPIVDIKKVDVIKNITRNLFAKFRNPYMIYPASYYAHKNHLRLLGALKVMHEMGFKIDLVLTGGVPHSSERIDFEISRLGLDNVVHQLGFVPSENLSNLIAQSEFVVVPSTYESKSFPVEESLTIKKAVFASDIPGIRDQILQKDFLFDPWNEFAIAEKLVWWLNLSPYYKKSLTEKLISSSAFRKSSETASDYYALWQNVVASRQN